MSVDYIFIARAFCVAILTLTAARSGEQSMTREERVQYLNQIRQTDPERLIAIYRTATNTPLMDQLPRGLGFTGMIQAILESEYGGANARQQYSISLRPTTVLRKQAAPQRRHTPMEELRAFCSGTALVCLGLLMAAFYFLVKDQIHI
jgi:hypothetical protein